MYKKSQFVDYKLGELHNLKNGRNIGKNHSLYKEIMDCFEKNGEGYENTEVLEILLKMGFLINEYVDEGALLRYQSNRNIYGDEMLELTLIMTDGCNFRCRYCYQGEHIHFMNDQVFENLMAFMKKAVLKYRIIHIDWFGGEPLLAAESTLKFMKQVKELCRENKTLLIINMTTNGYLLSVDLFKNLIRNMVLYYQVTLDGPASVHNKLRPLKNGEGTFEVILDNLRHIRDEVSSKRFCILIRVNIARDLMDEIDDFIRLLAEEFGSDSRFLFFPTIVREWGGERIAEMQDSLIEYEKIEEVHKKFAKAGLREPSRQRNYSNGYICAAARANGFIVNYDGTLHKCTIAMERIGEDIYYLNKIGFIDINGKLHIDEAKQALWVGSDLDKNKECYDCRLRSICMGTGCRLSKITQANRTCRWKKENSREI